MSTTSKTLLTDLPNELLELIFAKLAIRDVFRTETTCKKWKTLIWSSQTDIYFPHYDLEMDLMFSDSDSYIPSKRSQVVPAAIQKILTAADPVKIRKLHFNTRYELNEQDIAALKKMKSLKYLSVDFSNMTQERRSFIPYLTNLQHISLNMWPLRECIDTVGSAHLPHLTSLTIVSISPFNPSPLLTLTRVKALDLQCRELSNNTSVIALFTSMTQIETLNMARVKDMDSAAFESISCLTNLTDLSILNIKPVENGIAMLNKALPALSKLKSLDMKSFAYNSETLKILGDLSDLTKLVLYNVPQSTALSKLTNMQHLGIHCSPYILSTYGYTASDKFYSAMTNLTLLKTPIAASEFIYLDRLTQLKCLSIYATDQIDASFYPYVLKMIQLEHLDFQCSTFSAQELGSLSSLQFLTHLDVNYTSVNKENIPEVINSLVQLTNLRSLRTLSDVSVDWLLELPNLEQLDIAFPLPRNTSVSLTFLTPLLSMTKLYSLSMTHFPCSGNVGEFFCNHRNLTSLCVDNNLV